VFGAQTYQEPVAPPVTSGQTQVEPASAEEVAPARPGPDTDGVQEQVKAERMGHSCPYGGGLSGTFRLQTAPERPTAKPVGRFAATGGQAD